MFKVIRIIKGINRLEVAHEMFELVIQTMQKSSLALIIMFGFVIIAMIFFGSIIYVVEGGEFQATEDYPNGAFLRPTLNHHGVEISPFYSISTSFYWVIVTCTTGQCMDIVNSAYSLFNYPLCLFN